VTSAPSHDEAAMSERELDDIQGVILRGYRPMRRARHLLLQIERPTAFKALLRDLATEDRASGPFVTVASDWMEKPPVGEEPEHCVNIGLTYSGLRALGLPSASLESFPEEFREGAVERADRVGDTGANAPANWVEQLNPDNHANVHAVLSLFARTDEDLKSLTDEARSCATHDGAAREVLQWDAGALYPDEKREGYVHFGYRDGLSQPTIEGAPPAGIPDPLPPVPPGEFLLGHPSQRPRYSYPVPTPVELGRNGSFAAFRIAQQDVAGFEAFLTASSDGTPYGRELLAAKLCGRWRNGVPLVLSPESDSPVSRDALNMFDYATDQPDPDGARCPLGSHIRRANPRRTRVMGGGGEKRRIVRRGMPYGPPYDPARPDDGHARGLVGMFICVSLREQFEFVMSEWLNDGIFARGLGRTKDPLAGNNNPSGEFTAPGTPGVHLTGLSSFVTTRGGAYCFLPSMTALRYLAAL
jgi:Dyp-type peroxidase family